MNYPRTLLKTLAILGPMAIVVSSCATEPEQAYSYDSCNNYYNPNCAYPYQNGFFFGDADDFRFHHRFDHHFDHDFDHGGFNRGGFGHGGFGHGGFGHGGMMGHGGGGVMMMGPGGGHGGGHGH